MAASPANIAAISRRMGAQIISHDKLNQLRHARYFQNAASEYLYGLGMHYFHQMPLAVSTVFCYIKLKQFEEDLLTSVAEGLGLGMAGGEVFDLLEFAE